MFSILAICSLQCLATCLKKKSDLWCFGHHTLLFNLIEPCACRYEFRQDLVNHGMFVIQTFQNNDEIISFLCFRARVPRQIMTHTNVYRPFCRSWIWELTMVASPLSAGSLCFSMSFQYSTCMRGRASKMYFHIYMYSYLHLYLLHLAIFLVPPNRWWILLHKKWNGWVPVHQFGATSSTRVCMQPSQSNSTLRVHSERPEFSTYAVVFLHSLR